MSFARALPFCLEELEGGYVLTDRPSDPGGPTYAGITRSAWEGAGNRWAPPLPVIAIANFYRHYWDAANCAMLPEPADAVLFQLAVNLWTFHATICLQNAIGTWPDGHFGPQSLARSQKISRAELPELIMAAQRQYYFDRSQGPNLKGLLDRVAKVKAAIAAGTI